MVARPRPCPCLPALISSSREPQGARQAHPAADWAGSCSCAPELIAVRAAKVGGQRHCSKARSERWLVCARWQRRQRSPSAQPRFPCPGHSVAHCTARAHSAAGNRGQAAAGGACRGAKPCSMHPAAACTSALRPGPVPRAMACQRAGEGLARTAAGGSATAAPPSRRLVTARPIHSILCRQRTAAGPGPAIDQAPAQAHLGSSQGPAWLPGRQRQW